MKTHKWAVSDTTIHSVQQNRSKHEFIPILVVSRATNCLPLHPYPSQILTDISFVNQIRWSVWTVINHQLVHISSLLSKLHCTCLYQHNIIVFTEGWQIYWMNMDPSNTPISASPISCSTNHLIFNSLISVGHWVLSEPEICCCGSSEDTFVCPRYGDFNTFSYEGTCSFPCYFWTVCAMYMCFCLCGNTVDRTVYASATAVYIQ